MKAMRGKIRKLEWGLGVGEDNPDPLFQFTAQVFLAHNPDWALVRPEDTDAETYAKIEYTRAEARGDHAAVREYERRHPIPEDPCPPEFADSPGGWAAWSSRRLCRDDPPKGESSVERAIAKAKKRLAREAAARARAAKARAKEGGRA